MSSLKNLEAGDNQEHDTFEKNIFELENQNTG